MSYELQKITSRLENIRSVKPILAALRTISLGSWQMARSRQRSIQAFSHRLLGLLPVLVSHLKPSGLGWLRHWTRGDARPAQASGRAILLVIGSERGLVGGYNRALLESVRAFLGKREFGEIELMALGSRMVRVLTQGGMVPSWSRALSLTKLPEYGLAYGLVQEWLERYEAYDIDSVYIVYNADRGAGRYMSTSHRLLPPVLPEHGLSTAGHVDPRFHGVIVETDPVSLYATVVQQWAATSLYGILIEAALTEHATRYQLMESATQNADDLIEALMLIVQSARRQAITREMQELAVSAGLLAGEGR